MISSAAQRGLICAVLLLAGSGCSTIWSFEGEGPLEEPLPVELTEEIKATTEAPLTIEVAQAFFEEEDLRIKVRLSSKGDLDASKVVVGVVGLEEGEIVEQKVQQVSSTLGRTQLKAGDTVLLDFTLSGDGLTEYQIRGSWGEHAAKALLAERVQHKRLPEELEESVEPVVNDLPEEAESVEPASARARLRPPVETPKIRSTVTSRELTLENVELSSEASDCGEPNCSLLYTIHAELVNHETETLGEIDLAVGLYWANAGKLPQIPKHLAPLTSNEEHIPLGSLLLQPGSSKRVRIAVDREVPQVPGGEFIPHLRILRYRPLIPEPLVQ